MSIVLVSKFITIKHQQLKIHQAKSSHKQAATTRLGCLTVTMLHVETVPTYTSEAKNTASISK
jgi:hypothetical protein